MSSEQAIRASQAAIARFRAALDGIGETFQLPFIIASRQQPRVWWSVWLFVASIIVCVVALSLLAIHVHAQVRPEEWARHLEATNMGFQRLATLEAQMTHVVETVAEIKWVLGSIALGLFGIAWGVIRGALKAGKRDK